MFLPSWKVFRATKLKSRQQNMTIVGKREDGNQESTMANCLLDVGDGLGSLVSQASQLMVNLKHQSQRLPRKVTLSLSPLHRLLGLPHLKYFYFDCSVILDGRETSILHSKHFLRKLKVNIVPFYWSEGFKQKYIDVFKETNSSSFV